MTAPLEDIGAAAVELARQGLPVFPLHTINPAGRGTCGRKCASPGKHPRTPNGLLDATSTPSAVASWWSRSRLANIGLATGEKSGFVAIDLDGPAGESTFRYLQGGARADPGDPVGTHGRRRVARVFPAPRRQGPQLRQQARPRSRRSSRWRVCRSAALPSRVRPGVRVGQQDSGSAAPDVAA